MSNDIIFNCDFCGKRVRIEEVVKENYYTLIVPGKEAEAKRTKRFCDSSCLFWWLIKDK